MDSNASPRHAITPREWIAVVALLLIAFALRVIDLTRVPPGLHNDEVVAAKITESVANGRLAIFFPDDSGSEPLHYYFAAPIMTLFGRSVFALRLPAVALSLIALSVIGALARRLFGPRVALVTLAGFAITFWTVAFGRIVSPVVMLPPLGALSAYFFWRASATQGRRAWALWALSGLWLGMSILAYTASRILPTVFLAFGLYVWIARGPDWRRWWSGIALTLAVAAAVASPMFIYLAQNPQADQLDFFDIDRPLIELRQGNLAPVIETSLRTLGMFAFVGDPLPYYDVPGRPVLEPAGALLLLLGVLIAVRRWRRPEYAFVVLWFFLSLVPSMLSQPAPNYTRTLGAQIVLFMLPGIAIAVLTERWRSSILTAGLAALFAGNLVWTVHDYFTVWPSNPDVRFWHHVGMRAAGERLQRDPDTSPVAMCLPEYLIDEREPWWNPGWQHMHFLLQRPDLSLRYYNCADAMVFPAGPARYAMPDAGVDALDQFPIYRRFLAAAAPTLDVLPDQSGVIARADVSTLLDRHLAEVSALSPVEWVPEAGGGSARLPIDFGGKVEFLGYTLSPDVSESFDLVTYWRVIGDLPPQLSQFSHVVDAEGTIVAQQDRLALTSASLRPGDVFAQTHHLTLPSDSPLGNYSLTIGLYTLTDGARLPITQDGQPRGDRLWLSWLNASAPLP